MHERIVIYDEQTTNTLRSNTYEHIMNTLRTLYEQTPNKVWHNYAQNTKRLEPTTNTKTNKPRTNPRTNHEQTANKPQQQHEQITNEPRTNYEQTTNKQRTNHNNSTNKPQTNHGQTTSKLRETYEHNTDKPRRNNRQFTNKLRTDNEHTTNKPITHCAQTSCNFRTICEATGDHQRTNWNQHYGQTASHIRTNSKLTTHVEYVERFPGLGLSVITKWVPSFVVFWFFHGAATSSETGGSVMLVSPVGRCIGLLEQVR